MINKINPNDWYGTRRLSFVPTHFHTIVIQHYYEPLIEDWIIKNTLGRYAFGKVLVDPESADLLISQCIVGFEDPQEAVYFLLIKDSLFRLEEFF